MSKHREGQTEHSGTRVITDREGQIERSMHKQEWRDNKIQRDLSDNWINSDILRNTFTQLTTTWLSNKISYQLFTQIINDCKMMSSITSSAESFYIQQIDYHVDSIPWRIELLDCHHMIHSGNICTVDLHYLIIGPAKQRSNLGYSNHQGWNLRIQVVDPHRHRIPCPATFSIRKY